jgi:succinate dehydrogenase / fumarate reductase cytochrome b subunit
MKTDRPVNINPLTDYGWPFTALVSITNRVLGIVLFAGMAFALYLLDMALSSEQGFAEASTLINGTPVKLAVLFLIFALTYHLVAGIKHLLLDFHIGDTFEAAQVGSGIVVASSLLITGVIGVNLW